MTKTIRLAAALLTTGLALGAYTAGMAPAGAATDTVRTQEREIVATASETYKNELNGECLDDFGALSTYRCDGTDEQDWTVTRWNDGTVRFKNADTGDCLSDSGGTLGTDNCNTSESQSFWIKHWNDGTMRFKNQATGQCVEADNDSDVWSSTSCDSSQSQSWY